MAHQIKEYLMLDRDSTHPLMFFRPMRVINLRLEQASQNRPDLICL